MPDYMFVKVEDEEKPLNFVKNDNGDIVPEDANENSEATAEPVIGHATEKTKIRMSWSFPRTDMEVVEAPCSPHA